MVIELTFFLEMAPEKPFDGPSLTYLRCCEFSLLKETLCTPHPSTRLLISLPFTTKFLSGGSRLQSLPYFSCHFR